MALKQNPGYRAARQIWKEHVLNTTGTNFHVNENPHYAFITHPGLNYADFDMNGNPHITSLMQLTNDSFSLVVNPYYMKNGIKTSFMGWKDLFVDRTIFLASAKFEISRTIYNKSIPKWPLNAKISFAGVGSTSLLMVYQIFLPGTKEPLITRKASMVGVDFNTRKPVPFPEWFKREHKGTEMKEVTNFRVDRFPRSSNTFCERLKVLHSEIDENHHTNFASYVKFGLDTLHLALLQKAESSRKDSSLQVNAVSDLDRETLQDTSAIKWMTKNIVAQGVKRLDICFLQECVEGDIVDVHVWQEEGAELAVKCSVESLDKTPLAQFIIEYFAPSPNL